MDPITDATLNLKKALSRAIILPLIFVVTLLAVLFAQVGHLVRSSQRVDKCDQIISTGYRTEKYLSDMETGLRGFLLTNDYEFLAPYTEANSPLKVNLRALQVLVHDNAEQANRLKAIDHGIAEWDRSALQMISGNRKTGLTEQEILRHRSQMEWVRQLFTQFLSDEEARRLQLRSVAQNATEGSLFTGIGLMFLVGVFLVFFSRRQLYNVSQSYKRALGITFDRERRLRQSEEQFRFLTGAIPQIVWTSDAEGTADYYNQQWYDFTGLGIQQSLRNGFEYVVHPDDYKRTCEAWRNALERKDLLQVECRMLRAADNVYHWHLVRAVPFRDQQGKVVRWIGTCTDIHDQKRSEQLQRFLAEASSLLSSSLDYAATLKSVARLAVPRMADFAAVHLINKDSEEPLLLAFSHRDQQKTKVIWELHKNFKLSTISNVGPLYVMRTGSAEFFPDITGEVIARNQLSQQLRSAIEAIGVRSSICVPLIARDHILGSLTFGYAESGRRYNESDLNFAKDLARRVALALDNARLFEEAQSSSRAKDEFLATLSHELRTPLNVILGWVELLKTGQFDKSCFEEGLQALERNAKVQSALINDLLDVSKIISGKFTVDLKSISLGQVVRDAIESVHFMAKAKNIHLISDISEAMAPVHGDQNRLQQVISNLLTNAVKFTPAGGTIKVESSQLSDHQNIVRVIDSGRGMDPKFLPHVFDRFVQENAGTTRTHGGMGLGLAIVKHLVQLHGGSVRAESAGPGKGATFSVILPCLEARTTAQASGSESSVSPHPTLGLRPLSGLRVLITDDSLDVLNLIAVFLRRQGAQVLTASDGQEAIRLIQSSKPDVFLCDIGMPDEDGYAVIKKVRSLPKDSGSQIPAAALTAYARPEERIATLKAGFQLHLTKPITSADLTDAVLALAGRQNAQRPLQNINISS